MLEQIAGHVVKRESFTFETTLAGHVYARNIARWRAMGFHIELLFLSLPDVEIAVERVRERVRQGGHSVPEAVIRRRFVAGRRNFERIYRKLVDTWDLYDNSGPAPILLDWSESHDQEAD